MTLTKVAIVLANLHVPKRRGRHITLGLAILLGLLCWFPAVTQAADDSEQVHQGLPGRRVSGASRLPSTACAQNAGPLVAIVPETNLGATAVAEPILWLRVPDIASAKQLEFYLFDAQDKIIYQTSVTVDSSAELVGLDLGTMAHAPKLEVDQRYRWAASIVCNPSNHSENISVEGWVDRVEASDVEGTGLWYDRLGLLVEELQRYPNSQDVLSQWQTLMASARLDQIVPLSVDVNSVEIMLPTTAETDSEGL